MTLLLMLLDLASFVFLSFASILLVLVFLEYFKGLKMPSFWIYMILSFYLSVTAAFVEVSINSAELTQAIKLASNVFIFLGVFGAYKRMKTKI